MQACLGIAFGPFRICSEQDSSAFISIVTFMVAFVAAELYSTPSVGRILISCSDGHIVVLGGTHLHTDSLTYLFPSSIVSFIIS